MRSSTRHGKLQGNNIKTAQPQAQSELLQHLETQQRPKDLKNDCPVLLKKINRTIEMETKNSRKTSKTEDDESKAKQRFLSSPDIMRAICVSMEQVRRLKMPGGEISFAAESVKLASDTFQSFIMAKPDYFDGTKRKLNKYADALADAVCKIKDEMDRGSKQAVKLNVAETQAYFFMTQELTKTFVDYGISIEDIAPPKLQWKTAKLVEGTLLEQDIERVVESEAINCNGAEIQEYFFDTFDLLKEQGAAVQWNLCDFKGTTKAALEGIRKLAEDRDKWLAIASQSEGDVHQHKKELWQKIVNLEDDSQMYEGRIKDLEEAAASDYLEATIAESKRVKAESKLREAQEMLNSFQAKLSASQAVEATLKIDLLTSRVENSQLRKEKIQRARELDANQKALEEDREDRNRRAEEHLTELEKVEKALQQAKLEAKEAKNLQESERAAAEKKIEKAVTAYNKKNAEHKLLKSELQVLNLDIKATGEDLEECKGELEKLKTELNSQETDFAAIKKENEVLKATNQKHRTNQAVQDDAIKKAVREATAVFEAQTKQAQVDKDAEIDRLTIVNQNQEESLRQLSQDCARSKKARDLLEGELLHERQVSVSREELLATYREVLGYKSGN